MSTFARILIKNIIFAILFSACYLSFSIYSLTQFITEHQQDHQVTLKKITEHYQGDDIKGFAKQLRLAFEYDFLQISNLDGDVIYRFEEQPSMMNIVETSTGDIAPARIKNNNLSVYIDFKLNYDEVFNVYYPLTAFVFLSLLLVVFVGSLVTSSIASKANRVASKKVSELIASEIKKTIESRGKEDNQLKLPAEFQDVNTVLSQLKGFVTTKFMKTQQLEQTAYRDQLTGLENRSGFVDFFQRFSEASENTFGVLMVTRCSELLTINQVHGYQEGDRYLNQVANILSAHIINIDGAKVYRLNGSDFATFLPNITLTASESIAEELRALFNDYQQHTDFDSIAFSGIVKLDFNLALGELLALADTAVSLAQTKNRNAWHIQSASDLLEASKTKLGHQNWTKEISYVIENQSVDLLNQVIVPSGRNNKIYHEVLSRFTGSEGQVLPTAAFIAMAEKLDKIVLVDRLVIEKTLSEIKSKNLTSNGFGINLSIRSIHDQHFVIWLERRLLRDHDIATRLVFEIAEYGLDQNIKASSHFIDTIHRVGARVCIEHFGIGITSFKFFKELSPDYIKMDGSYTHKIQEDKNNQYFLRLMIDLAHRLGIRVLAESVETQEEKFTFDEIFVDGCQGYYLGKPEKI